MKLLAFFNQFGWGEGLLIFCIVLLLFGAKRIPQLARGIGKSLGEFRRAREEFEDEIEKAKESTQEAIEPKNKLPSKTKSE